ncbi:thioredoxin family protein [Telmatobacter sp. DSM 110680]|uniref:Thioredoxin family protein n=1 Tax=Telmatobacter sp. DSM 110680 TaxID=3036704 RepID=A0AAU7DMY8_9BACT
MLYSSTMKQQCYLVAIYLNWLILVGGVGYLLFTHHYGFAITWLMALPLVMWVYLRVFPSISQAMGYGKVDDTPAPDAKGPEPQRNGAAVIVTLYTGLGCPFCPIVEKRLQALRESMNFKIEKIDVTLRPDILASRGIRAVPVIELGERRIQGNATTEQLADLILGKPALVS